MREVYKQLLECVEHGNRAAVVSNYSGSGIVKSLLLEDDYELRSKSDGADEGHILSTDGNGMTMVEYYSPKQRLIILGGGHIALPLSKFGASLGFRTAVYDDRPSFANKARFPDAETVICDGFDNLMKRVNIGKTDYVVVVTRGHRHDSLCLRGILCGEFPRYVGMIGSKRRVAIVKQQLEEETGEAAKLTRLHAPIGLPIGAVTLEEIALSILAEIVQEKRLGAASGGRALSELGRYLTPDMDLLKWLAENHGEKAALVTIVSTDGSTPRETGAKILSPNKKVLLPAPNAGCPMADMVEPWDVLELKRLHPDGVVMCYVNSSAAVKAVSDICCTSSSAVRIAKSLDAKKIIFIPDRHLGEYTARQVPEKEFVLWQSFCPTHFKITEEDVLRAKAARPNAKFTAHPECRAEVLKYADHIGSTAEIIDFTRKTDAGEVIIGTEMGILERLQRELPNKKLYSVSSGFICPNMKKTGLSEVLHSHKNETHQVVMPVREMDAARRSLDRMIAV